MCETFLSEGGGALATGDESFQCVACGWEFDEHNGVTKLIEKDPTPKFFCWPCFVIDGVTLNRAAIATRGDLARVTNLILQELRKAQ